MSTSDWDYMGGATQISDFANRGPWTIEVGGSVSSTVAPEVGSSITFTVIDDRLLSVTIQSDSVSAVGDASYNPVNSTVSGKFTNTGQFAGTNPNEVIFQQVVMVASLARFEDAVSGEDKWHIYALVVGNDAEDAAVIGGLGEVG